MTTLDPGASGHQVLSDAEIASLRGWMRLKPGQKVDFFEEMVDAGIAEVVREGSTG